MGLWTGIFAPVEMLGKRVYYFLYGMWSKNIANLNSTIGIHAY